MFGSKSTIILCILISVLLLSVLFYSAAAQKINNSNVTSESENLKEAKNREFAHRLGGCILPPHPPFGSWHLVANPFNSSPGLQVPANSVLEINCDETYKLDGCRVAACINGKWVPPIGRCLKTCPSIYSSSTTKVTCMFKEQETVNCTESVEGTLAQFKCESFYEDTRLFKSKAVCVDGKWSENVPECTPVCGRAVVKKRPTLIVHGDKTKKGDFPWQTALYTAEDKVLICGGTLLSERVVLTAAHCVTNDDGDPFPKENFLVVVGKYYRKFDHPDDFEHRQVSEIYELFVSDLYEGEEQNFQGDIAVLITKTAIKFSKRVQPVCIDWTKRFEDAVLGSEKRKGYVSGWGHTKTNSEPANELRSIKVPSISRSECKNILPEDYRRYMTHDKFCAGYKNNGTSVCGGDSGGGLVFKREGRFFIAGIVSLAPLANAQEGGCDNQQYSLYTLVYNYTDNFILKKLAEFKSLDTKKTKDTKDQECTYCTTTETTFINTEPFTETAVTDTILTEPPSVQCILPQHPKSGKWAVLETASTFSPGDYVESDAILVVTCDKLHKYDQPSFSYCNNGDWTPTIGKCQKICPPLSNSTKMQVTCLYDDKNLENCTEAVEGTIAKFQCSPFYEFANSDTRPVVCANGAWTSSQGSSLPECVPACGRKSVNTTKEHKPWQIIVYKKLDNGTFMRACGGNLISTNIVVTVAHCVADSRGYAKSKEDFIVAAGKDHPDFDHSEVTAQFSKPRDVLIPRQYRGDVQNFLGDIALIVVEKPFVLSNAVQPVCVDWSAKMEIPFGQQGILSGWILEKSWALEEFALKVIPSNECLEAIGPDYEQYLTRDKFCAQIASNHSSFCKGTSGEGLVFQVNNKYYLEGVLGLLAIEQYDQICSPSKNVSAMLTGILFYTDNFILKALARYKD